MPAHLPNARIARCGEHGQVSRGLTARSTSKGWSSEVILRCVAAGRRSALDVSLTLSGRREDLRRFTKGVGRRYLFCSSASRVRRRVFWGRFCTRHRIYRSDLRGHAVAEAAVAVPRAWTALGHREVRKKVPVGPLIHVHSFQGFKPSVCRRVSPDALPLL